MSINFWGLSLWIPELLVLLMLICRIPKILLLGKIYIKSEFNYGIRWIFVGSAIFFISLLISTYMSVNPMESIKQIEKWMYIFAIIFIIFFSVNNQRSFTILWASLVFILVVDILYGLFQVASINYYSLRNIAGHSSVGALALIVPFADASRLALVSSICFVLLTIVSLSRGAWLSLFIISGYLMTKVGYLRKYLIIIVMIVSFLLVIMPLPREMIVERIISFNSTQPSASNMERFGLTKTAILIFSKFPLFGIGAGNFQEYLMRDSSVPLFVTSRFPEKLTPHNFYLQIAAEQGILGVIGITFMLLGVHKLLFQYHRPSEIYRYLRSLKFFALSLAVMLSLGYVAGKERVIVGIFLGLVLATARIFPAHEAENLMEDTNARFISNHS